MKQLIRGMEAGWIGMLDGELVSNDLPEDPWRWLFTTFFDSKDL